MAQHGWILNFPKPSKGFEQLPNRQATAQAMTEHFQRCFKQLEPLLTAELRYASRHELFGFAVIVGPEDACLGLKEQVEALGLATMTPNTDDIQAVQCKRQ